MTVNRTTLLDLPLPVTGTESGTWGDTTNNGLTQYLDIAIAGSLVLSADSDTTLSSTEGDSSATNIGGTTAQYAVLRCTGARTATRNINAPAWAISGGTLTNYSKIYIVVNETTGSQNIVLRATNSATPTYTTGVTIVPGERAVCAWNGSDFVKVGGAAGGTNTQVQYNNAGVFGGITNATTDGTTLSMTSPKVITSINDTNGAELLKVTATATAVNELTLANAATGNAPTLSATGDDLNIGITLTPKGTGAVTVSTLLNVDNLRLDGNTLSSTDSNGNIVLAPNGTGDVQLDADTVRIGDSNTAATLTTNGTGNLTISTNSGTNSGTIVINQGADANIEVAPNGTGDVYLTADTVRIGDSNANATLTTNGTGDLILSTNSGTNSGTITIQDGVNGNIILAPNGTGAVQETVSSTNYNIVSQSDIGTAPNEIPLNQYLGDLAYQDSAAVTVGSLTASGNIILSTAGAGIDFSATANSSGTMTSELLSDYEEGTWTPAFGTTGTAFTGITYTGQDGTYTKVGRLVTASLRISTSAVTVGSASGDLLITGLPFTSLNTFGYWIGSVLTAGTATNEPSIVRVRGSATTADLYYYSAAVGSTAVPATSLDAVVEIRLTVTYVV